MKLAVRGGGIERPVRARAATRPTLPGSAPRRVRLSSRRDLRYATLGLAFGDWTSVVTPDSLCPALADASSPSGWQATRTPKTPGFSGFE